MFISITEKFVKQIRPLTLILAGIVLILTATPAFAAGTPAGTVISSRAKAIFTDLSSGAIDSVYSNIVSVTVAQVAAVNVLPASNARSSGDGVSVDYPLSVVNSGNGTDRFSLAGSSPHGWTILLYHDVNGNALLDPAELASGSVSVTDSVKADSSYKLMVLVTIPDNELLNGQSDSTTVAATSQFDGSKASASLIQTNILTARINAGSALSVDNASPNPPGPVVFTFSATNSGLAAATNVLITDKLDPRFTYVSSTNGGAHPSSDSVKWSIPSIGAGASVIVTVALNVPTNLPAGTIIPNVMTIYYLDGTLARTKPSNTVNVGIGNVFGVSIAPDSMVASLEPLDSVKYYFTVKNTGNIKDVVELSSVSSQPLSWSFIRDVNNNHLIDIGDRVLTNTNAKAGVDVDSVATGDSVHVIALALLPMVQFDQTVDATTFTGTSSGNALRTQSSSATTTTNIPVVNVAVSVFPPPTQQPPPGAVLTYTISYSNSGHADIDTSFTLTSPVPNNTKFVLGSAKLGAVSLPDSMAVKNGVVTIKTGMLRKSTSGTAEFKVKID